VSQTFSDITCSFANFLQSHHNQTRLMEGRQISHSPTCPTTWNHLQHKKPSCRKDGRPYCLTV